jgi:cellulose synthase/poly-beta-1,6-N-acetylglucosamine synthase-like glycosyltransferase
MTSSEEAALYGSGYSSSSSSSSGTMLNQDFETDWIHWCLLRTYFGCLAVIWFYSLSRWKNLLVATWLYFHQEDRNKEEEDDKGNDFVPAVTVQILSYNEAKVVPTTIAKACALDWPIDRLFIQVLDDSTDPTAAQVVQEAVQRHAQRGINVRYLTRPTRVGYKAGNLAHHFDDITTEFVLYLDGDHQVEPQLLRRVMKRFHNQERLALVQTVRSR